MEFDKEQVKKLAEQAAAAVSGIENDELRKTTYSIIFERLLYEEFAVARGAAATRFAHTVDPVHDVAIPVQQSVSSGEPEGKGLAKIMNTQFDWSKYSFIHKLEPYVQYMLILRIGLEEFGVDGLTPPEIQKILAEKFRILKVYNTISMAMAHFRGRYVDRVRQGAGYAYKISQAGLNKIDQSINDLKNKGEIS